MSEGLEKRYDVKKINDPQGKHADCIYFVLDPKHDKYARAALAYYANRVEIGGKRKLAVDLRRLVESCEPTAPQES